MSESELIETAAGLARLRRTGRRTLAISVLPDGMLELTAPEGAELGVICEKVARRLGWIGRQRRAFAEMNAVRVGRRYVGGATHRYLGRQYRLKLVADEGERVVLRGGWIEVRGKDLGEEAVERALRGWFRRLAEEQFRKRVEGWREWCRRRGLPAPKLRLLRMARRWGSAQPNGTIVLNPELIHAPSVCVDYVIAHEICHLVHPDHGRGFRALLGQLVPGWEVVKGRLEAGGEW
jgi:predicted metal-dependent hydrolase